MRIIKFQGVTKENNIVKKVGKIEFFTDGKIIINDEIPVKYLREWTGLLDKNGREIWEGDVIEITNDVSAGKKRVAWDDRRGQWNWVEDLNPDQTLLSPFCGMYGENKTEVIGNIFENPELLSNQ